MKWRKANVVVFLAYLEKLLLIKGLHFKSFRHRPIYTGREYGAEKDIKSRLLLSLPLFNSNFRYFNRLIFWLLHLVLTFDFPVELSLMKGYLIFIWISWIMIEEVTILQHSRRRLNFNSHMP